MDSWFAKIRTELRVYTSRANSKMHMFKLGSPKKVELKLGLESARAWLGTNIRNSIKLGSVSVKI